MGGGGSETTQSSYPQLYSWQQLLPPWVQAGQKAALPYLFERAVQGGMTPKEEELLSGMMRQELASGAAAGQKALGQRMAASGLSTSSPLYAGAASDIESGRVASLSDALANLAKLKMGAGESARQQLLTALYTPPPYAVGQVSQSQSSQGGSK